MAILVDEKTVACVQGITGKEGSKAAKQMRDYGTKVVAGVTPGKGGETVEGIPVYDTLEQAKKAHPEINATSIYVPPAGAKDAAIEALANGVSLVHVFSEKVPMADTAFLLQYARGKGARLVGPSSIGILSPGRGKMGSIGGGNPAETFQMGRVGVISKSGGMVREICWLLMKAGLGNTTAIGMGGDVIAGSIYSDLMELFEKDKETKAVVIFGEHGGTYEQQAAQMLKAKKFTKPLIALIAGRFAGTLPDSVQLGHASAIIEGKWGTTESKIEELRKAGAHIAKIPDDIPDLVKKFA